MSELYADPHAWAECIIADDRPGVLSVFSALMQERPASVSNIGSHVPTAVFAGFGTVGFRSGMPKVASCASLGLSLTLPNANKSS